MNIKIENYISDEEIKDIIKEEIRKNVKYHLNSEKDLSRIIANISYKELWKQIELEIPNCEKMLKDKTIEKLNELSSYDIFRRKDCYGAEDSLAIKLIDKYVEENKKIINDKIKNVFNGLSNTDLKYDIQAILEEYIAKIFKEEENKK